MNTLLAAFQSATRGGQLCVITHQTRSEHNETPVQNHHDVLFTEFYFWSIFSKITDSTADACSPAKPSQALNHDGKL